MKSTCLRFNPFLTRNSALLPAMAALVLSAPSLMAADQTWGGAASTTTTGDYSTATNWSAATIPTGVAQTDRAIFNGVNGAAATAITLNANRTARLVFSGSTSYTLSGGSFTAGSGADMVNLDSANAANQTVNSDLYFGVAAGQINILRNSSTGGRTLNLGGNIGGQTAAAGFANSLQINSATGNLIVMSGIISDTLAGRTNSGGVFNLQKTGGSPQSGNLTLNGNNTYTGGTDYFAGSGSFTLGHKNALGSGDLRLNGGGVTLNANTALTGSNAIANTVRFNGTLSNVAGTTSITPAASGSTTATVSDATGLAVGQVINYQGATRNYAIGTYITAISGTTVTLSTPALSAAAISSGAGRFQSYGSGSGTTAFDGSNAIEFSGTTYLGSTRASAGTATQIFNVTNTAGVTLSGKLTQETSIQAGGGLVQGALTKTGAGTLTLSSTMNDYKGATLVSNGKLVVNGNISTSSLVTVSSGATLGGSGTVSAASVSGTLAIGNSAGIMNFASLILASGSTFQYEMKGGDGVADLGDISGNLTINTTSILDLVELGTYTAGNKFTLFAYDGTLSGNFSTLTNHSTFNDDLANSWRIQYDDATAGLNGGVGTRYVTITAVPEPTAAALVGGCCLLGLLRRRRVA